MLLYAQTFLILSLALVGMKDEKEVRMKILTKEFSCNTKKSKLLSHTPLASNFYDSILDMKIFKNTCLEILLSLKTHLIFYVIKQKKK